MPPLHMLIQIMQQILKHNQNFKQTEKLYQWS